MPPYRRTCGQPKKPRRSETNGEASRAAVCRTTGGVRMTTPMYDGTDKRATRSTAGARSHVSGVLDPDRKSRTRTPERGKPAFASAAATPTIGNSPIPFTEWVRIAPGCSPGLSQCWARRRSRALDNQQYRLTMARLGMTGLPQPEPCNPWTIPPISWLRRFGIHDASGRTRRRTGNPYPPQDRHPRTRRIEHRRHAWRIASASAWFGTGAPFEVLPGVNSSARPNLSGLVPRRCPPAGQRGTIEPGASRRSDSARSNVVACGLTGR